MELHELEVAHLRTTPVRHREAVAGRYRGVRRLAEHASGATRRQQHGTRVRDPRPSVATHEPHATALAAHQIDRRRQRVVEHANAGSAATPVPERAGDLTTGDVTRVQHAPDAVGAFPRERRRAIRIPIERHAPVDQLAHVPRSFVDQQIDRGLIAQPRAGGKRIGQMQFG